MANLLPQLHKRHIVRIYWMRVAAVWLYLIATGCGIVVVLTIPTLVSLAIQKDVQESQINALHAHTNGTPVREVIETANTRITRLSPKDHVLFSRILADVVSNTGDAVTVTTVAYESVSDSTEMVVRVEGTAATRSALTSYRDELQSQTHIAAVELPIESFAGNDTLPFSLTLTVSDPDTL